MPTTFARVLGFQQFKAMSAIDVAFCNLMPSKYAEMTCPYSEGSDEYHAWMTGWALAEDDEPLTV